MAFPNAEKIWAMKNKNEAGKKLLVYVKKPDAESKIDSSSGFMSTEEIAPDIM